jgi:hypothetical protein
MKQPEALYVVTRADDEVLVQTPDKQLLRISISDISRIYVVTNDSGPCGADVWFMFANANTRQSVAYPLGAMGEQDLLDWMLTLSGFELRGMNSVENAEFLCWSREGDSN